MWICLWVQVFFTIIPQNLMSTHWCTKVLLFYRHLFARRMWKWVMNSYWIMGQHIGRPHGVACQRVTHVSRDRMLLREKGGSQNRKKHKWFEKCFSKVVSTHLWNTPLNLYQQAIKGFLSQLALPGDCRTGVRYRGVLQFSLSFAKVEGIMLLN